MGGKSLQDAAAVAPSDLDELKEILGDDDSAATTANDKVNGLQALRCYRSLPDDQAARKKLQEIYALYAPIFGKEKLQARLRQEIGQRRRFNLRHLPMDDPAKAVSDDEAAVRETILRLAKAHEGALVIPSRDDKRLVGRPVYVGGNPPNPYMWAPALHQSTKDQGIVWEMGPGLASSAAIVGQVLGREVHLVQLPAPGDTTHSRRLVHGANRVPPVPNLVLLPLPLPVDRWTLSQHRRQYKLGMDIIWLFPDSPNDNELPKFNSDLHPEFSTNLNTYITATLARLTTLKKLVDDHGTKVCITIPMCLGLPHSIDKAIKKELGWLPAAKWTVIEERGTTHIGNGQPIVGEKMTVWEARR